MQFERMMHIAAAAGLRPTQRGDLKGQAICRWPFFKLKKFFLVSRERRAKESGEGGKQQDVSVCEK